MSNGITAAEKEKKRIEPKLYRFPYSLNIIKPLSLKAISMWDGIDKDGNIVVKYKTQNIYDMLSKEKGGI